MARIGIVFLGTECAGSEAVLGAMLAKRAAVQGVVLASRGDRAAGPGTLEGMAGAAGVPVVRAGGMGSGVVERIAGWGPEAVVAACWPWRVPAEVRGLPRLGCLNVHPSLLPVGRGPEPIFWTLRRGERRTGATVHLMDAGFDTGPVVAQAAIAVPAGVRAPALERRLMELGGRLLVATLPRLAAGEIAAVAQDAAAATAAPTPTAGDWAVPTNLPARWAFNFVRGVAPLGGPLTVEVGATGERHAVRDAIDLDEDGRMGVPAVNEGGGVLRVRFRPGWVRFRAG